MDGSTTNSASGQPTLDGERVIQQDALWKASALGGGAIGEAGVRRVDVAAPTTIRLGVIDGTVVA